ncbi:hypothetical protein [Arthrobacter castelli]|uniref:hypothetical protein n=1 Tax=Arthrobacter castelli TaxID=271431 RepID=UPI001B7FC04A|nr:hypothetical protein [Arthrobacter castelli]
MQAGRPLLEPHSPTQIRVRRGVPWGAGPDKGHLPDGWPQSPAYSGWLDSPDFARLYGEGTVG